MCVYVCVYACMYACIYVCAMHIVHVCVYMYLYMNACVYVYIYMNVYGYVCVCVYMLRPPELVFPRGGFKKYVIIVKYIIDFTLLIIMIYFKC